MSAVWLITSHFLQMETFSAKQEFSAIFIIIQQNSANANLEKILCLMHDQNWVKNVLSFGK